MARPFEVKQIPIADADLSDYLRLVSEASEELLGVASVGCYLADRRGELRLVAWTSDEVLDLERLEIQGGRGPAVDCFATSQPVVNIGRAEARRRWPEVSSRLAEAGSASMHALPLRAGGNVIGVLSLYLEQRRELTTHEFLMCQTLIHVAGTRLRHARASGHPDGQSQRPRERYRVGELIGQGGMADVHLARDVDHDRVVAIKTPRTDRVGEPGLVEQFRREGRTSARLEHPSIVSIIGTGDREVPEPRGGGVQLPYIVMEHVAGVTLRTLVGAGAGLELDEALRVTDDILGALAYAHAHGVVHGDVTATNVMLASDGTVKLLDFGSSHTVTELDPHATQSSDVTPAYGSPERVKGLAIDLRADLYSVGCVLYELLTGRVPFVADSPVDLAYRQVHEAPQPPSAHRHDIGAQLDAVVLRALAKSPAARYQSALEFRVDLIAAADKDRLDAAIIGLSILTIDPLTLPEVLAGVARLCQLAVPGATGAGLRLLQGAPPDTAAASTELVRELEALQYRLQEGPGLAAVAGARTVRCDSLDAQPSWPALRHGVRHLDVQSVLSVPLLLAGQVLGAISVYAPEPGAFDEQSVTAAERFASSAALTVRNAQLFARARLASSSRRTAELAPAS